MFLSSPTKAKKHSSFLSAVLTRPAVEDILGKKVEKSKPENSRLFTFTDYVTDRMNAVFVKVIQFSDTFKHGIIWSLWVKASAKCNVM